MEYVVAVVLLPVAWMVWTLFRLRREVTRLRWMIAALPPAWKWDLD